MVRSRSEAASRFNQTPKPSLLIRYFITKVLIVHPTVKIITINPAIKKPALNPSFWYSFVKAAVNAMT